MFVRDVENRWYEVVEADPEGKQVPVERVRELWIAERTGKLRPKESLIKGLDPGKFVRSIDNRWYQVVEADLKGKQVPVERAREFCIAERAEKRRRIDGLIRGLDRDEIEILREDLTDQDNLMFRPASPGPVALQPKRSDEQRLSAISAKKRGKVAELLQSLDEDEMEILLENLAGREIVTTGMVRSATGLLSTPELDR